MGRKRLSEQKKASFTIEEKKAGWIGCMMLAYCLKGHLGISSIIGHLHDEWGISATKFSGSAIEGFLEIDHVPSIVDCIEYYQKGIDSNTGTKTRGNLERMLSNLDEKSLDILIESLTRLKNN